MKAVRAAGGGTAAVLIDAAKRTKARQRRMRIDSRLAYLRLRNRRSSSAVTGSAEVVVSLTTHGKRLANVFYAIESIACGSVKPLRLMLWLDDDTDRANLPTSLRRLQDRGLEIGHSANYGPHTKYFPYVMSTAAHELRLVTADDDIVYSRSWLASLLSAARSTEPGRREIVCHRARTIQLVDGAISPYASWPFTSSSRPSVLHFATGVGGALYPPHFLTALHEAGDQFLALCPRADDVWLHVMALRHGYEVRQAKAQPRGITVVPFDKDIALWRSNVDQGGNDSAIAATYTTEDVATLIRAQDSQLAD